MPDTTPPPVTAAEVARARLALRDLEREHDRLAARAAFHGGSVHKVRDAHARVERARASLDALVRRQELARYAVAPRADAESAAAPAAPESR